MAENDTHATDGGTEAATGRTDRGTDDHRSADYLNSEVNIFNPSTPFMRDHLRVIWTMFAAWAVIVFAPVTATYLATDLMTSITLLGFPLHYMLTAIVAPLGALVLSFVYARKRDALDEKYGIDHSTQQSTPETDATATDGGVER
jgi:putative solute:sodium symporter small subunit